MTAEIRRFSPADAHAQMREGYTYLDVRTEAEFEEGHPEGAYNVPVQHAEGSGMIENPDFLRVMRATFANDAKLVVGCKSGVRSQRAAKALVEAGFTNVVEQRAGWAGVRSPFGELKEKGWQGSGLPSEEGSPAGRCYADLRARA